MDSGVEGWWEFWFVHLVGVTWVSEREHCLWLKDCTQENVIFYEMKTKTPL